MAILRPFDHLTDENSEEELITAAERGNTADIKELLEAETDVNCRQVNNWTPLHLVAGNGHTEAARMLIEFQVNVDAVDNAGKTPLHLAIEYKEDEVAEMLKGYQ